MINRSKYLLEKSECGNVVWVTVDGVESGGVTADGHYSFYRKFPKYIIRESKNIIKACPFEIARGFNFGGAPCVVGDYDSFKSSYNLTGEQNV